MKPAHKNSFSVNLKSARELRGISQAGLATRTQFGRTKIVRMETGHYIPSIDEALLLAQALRIPLQWLVTGRVDSSVGLRGIAFELQNLGIADFEVSGAEVPGAFRRPEEVVALALSGNSPEPRIVEAIPLVLATRPLDVPLTLAFANLTDKRVGPRLGWLSDITLALGRMGGFPVAIERERQLEAFIAASKKPTEPDSLGHPSLGEQKLSPIWRRWNVTYVASLDHFLERVKDAYHAAPRSQS